jgi:hypothetical protein
MSLLLVPGFSDAASMSHYQAVYLLSPDRSPEARYVNDFPLLWVQIAAARSLLG